MSARTEGRPIQGRRVQSGRTRPLRVPAGPPPPPAQGASGGPGARAVAVGRTYLPGSGLGERGGGGGAQGQGQPAKRGEGSGGPSRRCAPPAARLAAAAAPGGRRADDGWPVRRPGSEQRGAGECKHERAPRLPALGGESERPAQKDPARNV